MLRVISELTIKQNSGTVGSGACTYFVYDCEYKEDVCIRTTEKNRPSLLPFLKVIAGLNFVLC